MKIQTTHIMIYRVALLLIIFAPINYVFTQVKAITEKGDTIFVYDNGTWSFDEQEVGFPENNLSFLEANLSIDTLAEVRAFNPACDKEVESESKQLKFKYNTKIYNRVPPATLNPDAEFAFQSKDKGVFCMIITEPTEIPAEQLFKIAKHTMKQRTGADAEVLLTEMVKVNGVELIRGVLSCNISGLDLVFDSYYYADERGSVQVTSWTSNRVWMADNNIILDIINGVQILK